MNHLFQFFLGGKAKEEGALSQPISIRIPQKLLKQIDAQSEEIGGERYRSKHFINLMEVGAKYFSARTEQLRSLPIHQFELHLRLGFVFYKLNLNLSVIAEKWGDTNVAQWCRWLEGQETPSFAVLERFAKEYCLDAEWLKHGPKREGYEFALHQVSQLPSNCYSNFYDFAKFIFNLHTQKVQTIRIIRNKLNGEVLLDLNYGSNNSITVDCSRILLLDVDSIGSTGEFHLQQFIQFIALFSYHKNYPLTYSIGDEYFNKIKLGEETFQSTNFLAQDANDFNSSEQWAHILVHPNLVAKMEQLGGWVGSNKLLSKLYEDQELQKIVSAIKDIQEYADVPSVYFQESIELFSNFYKDYYGDRKSVVALDIPAYFGINENYLISGSSKTHFLHFAISMIEHKVKRGDGLIYINATGCEDDLKLMKSILCLQERSDCLYEVDRQGVSGLYDAIQNKKIIYISIQDAQDPDKAKNYLSYVLKELNKVLSKTFYINGDNHLAIFTNECVELFGDEIMPFLKGAWPSFETNMVITDQIETQAKIANEKFKNSALYEKLLSYSKNRIVYKPDDCYEEKIRTSIFGKENISLLKLENDEFAILNYRKKVNFVKNSQVVFMPK